MLEDSIFYDFGCMTYPNSHACVSNLFKYIESLSVVGRGGGGDDGGEFTLPLLLHWNRNRKFFH